MEYTYKLKTGYVADEKENKVKTYGIRVIDLNGNTFKEIPDIFFNKHKAIEFIRLCNQHKLSVTHLQDVIQDQLAI